MYSHWKNIHETSNTGKCPQYIQRGERFTAAPLCQLIFSTDFFYCWRLQELSQKGVTHLPLSTRRVQEFYTFIFHRFYRFTLLPFYRNNNRPFEYGVLANHHPVMYEQCFMIKQDQGVKLKHCFNAMKQHSSFCFLRRHSCWLNSSKFLMTRLWRLALLAKMFSIFVICLMSQVFALLFC